MISVLLHLRKAPGLPFCILGIAGLLLLASSSATAAPRPWAYPEALLRAVFTNDRAVAAIALPRVGGGDIRDVRAFAFSPQTGKETPLHASLATSRTADGHAIAIVEGGPAPAGADIHLYAFRKTSDLPNRPASTNRACIRLSFLRIGVEEAPPRLESLLFMAARRPAARRVTTIDVPGIGDYTSGVKGMPSWYHGGWQNYNYVASFSGLLDISASGKTTFAVAAQPGCPALLLIDGAPVVYAENREVTPNQHRRRPPHHRKGDGQMKEGKRPNGDGREKGERRQDGAPSLGGTPPPDRLIGPDGLPEEAEIGEPVDLPKGVVPFRLITLCRQTVSARVWVRPAQEEAFSPVGASLSLAPAFRRCRIEMKHGAFSAAADFTAGEPYRFYTTSADGCRKNGQSPVFTPVRLIGLCDPDAEVDCSWLDGAGTFLGKGRILDIALTNRVPMTVQLRARKAEEKPVHDTATLPLGAPPAAEYRLASSCVGMPSYSYEDDLIRAEIHLRSDAPSSMDFHVRAELVDAEGAALVSAEGDLRLHRSWARLLLPPHSALGAAALRWEVLHAGVAIESRELRLARAPYPALDAANGDYFVADGKLVALVAPQSSRDGEATSPDCTAKRALFLDGYGVALTPAFSNALRRAFGAVSPPPVDRIGPASGDGRPPTAFPFPAPRFQIPDRIQPSAVQPDSPEPRPALLFAPDLRIADQAELLPEYERRAAAAASYLHATLGYDVLLVTPPADLLPDARDYASAIYRVADATGLRVLDLYSASRIQPTP